MLFGTLEWGTNEKHPENQLLVSECEIIYKIPFTKAFGNRGKKR